MAQDLDNLGGHVGEVLLKERPFTDPWGWNITGIVRRIDDPDYRQAELELNAAKPDAHKLRLATAENIFSDLRPDGFRQGKKLTKREAYERMVRKAAEPGEVVIDLLDLREKKPLIARLLCRTDRKGAAPLMFRGESIVRRNGKEFDLSTPEGRLGLMDHTLWEFQEGDEVKEHTTPLFKRGPDGELELDDYEEPIEHILGGKNVGDALAYLLLREAKDLASFVDQRGKEVLEPFGATSTGSTATGSPSPSPSGE
jgi:hypothetical protein